MDIVERIDFVTNNKTLTEKKYPPMDCPKGQVQYKDMCVDRLVYNELKRQDAKTRRKWERRLKRAIRIGLPAFKMIKFLTKPIL